MCLKYAELEKSLGEDRARGIYVFASQFADPRSDADFWNEWHEFEVQHGNEDTFREMLRIKRSVSASYSQTHFILPEYLMQKDQRLNIDEAKDKLKQAGVPEDEMVNANQEDIELPEESDSEDDEKVEITQKDVPTAVFGGLARKREETEKAEGGDDAAAAKDGAGHLGALERIKS
ncbi:hypothetical protein GH714_001780 [Hevea brasiliensis]|uniref:Pre-mRNA-splicing factor Syf1/CRNKL1-like C-terminal HAT-repeats domain-containing protein n=1 Tax=Hevea brasiliensis TaxID=3981 RepID=A0A6A6LZH3_HEVBR|nr:hypothetical protein GH714_001780 [Hevea brasiliensis]